MKSSNAGEKNAEAVPEELFVVKPIYILEIEVSNLLLRTYYCSIIKKRQHFRIKNCFELRRDLSCT